MGGLSFIDNNTELSINGFDDVGGSLMQVQQINQQNFKWLEISTKVNYIVNPSSRWQAFIGAGLSARKPLKAQNQITIYRPGAMNSDPINYSVLDYYKNLNLFGSFAMGVQHPLKYNDALLIYFSVDRSLSDLLKPVEQKSNSLFDYGVQVPQQHLTNFSLNVTYVIR